MKRLTAETATKGVGLFVLLAGIVGFLVVAYNGVRGGQPDGTLPGVAIVLLLIGLSLAMPELLKDDTNQVSSMRVVVLVVVATFALLTTKAGWKANSLADLRLDGTWAWLLGAALGGKALQSFSEYRGAAGSTGNATPASVDPAVPAVVRAVAGPGKSPFGQTSIEETKGPTERPS